MQEHWWGVFVKGFIIGGTMIVPGVSGGTMAMILGIYDSLISSVGAIRKKTKATLAFLAVFCVGAGLGLFLFTTPISWMLSHYENPTLGFFVGAVVGGVPLICRKSGVEKVSSGSFLWLLAGALITVVLMAMPVNGLAVTKENFFLLIAAGVLASVALILPGISFSHFLLLLGLYGGLLESIKNIELGFLVPLAFGVLSGILIFCRILEGMMFRYPKQSYLLILGFVAGSVGQIFPKPETVWEAVICVLAAGAGCLLTYRSCRMEG